MIKYFIEIKNRIFLLFLLWFFVFSVCYIYKEILLFFLIHYFINFNFSLFYFIFTNVTEVFSVYFTILYFINFQIVCWYLVYHIVAFLNPALFVKEYQYLNFFFKLFNFFFVFSFFLSNYLLIPLTWYFFLSFKPYFFSKIIYFEAKLNEYLNFYIYVYFFCFTYCQAFALFFLFLQNTSNDFFIKIKKLRKLYYYIFVFFSTLVSPEIITQILLSLSLTFIYELVLFFLIYSLSFYKIIKKNNT